MVWKKSPRKPDKDDRHPSSSPRRRKGDAGGDQLQHRRNHQPHRSQRQQSDVRNEDSDSGGDRDGDGEGDGDPDEDVDADGDDDADAEGDDDADGGEGDQEDIIAEEGEKVDDEEEQSSEIAGGEDKDSKDDNGDADAADTDADADADSAEVAPEKLKVSRKEDVVNPPATTRGKAAAAVTAAAIATGSSATATPDVPAVVADDGDSSEAVTGMNAEDPSDEAKGNGSADINSARDVGVETKGVIEGGGEKRETKIDEDEEEVMEYEEEEEAVEEARAKAVEGARYGGVVSHASCDKVSELIFLGGGCFVGRGRLKPPRRGSPCRIAWC